jgi:hypothetical protein
LQIDASKLWPKPIIKVRHAPRAGIVPDAGKSRSSADQTHAPRELDASGLSPIMIHRFLHPLGFLSG